LTGPRPRKPSPARSDGLSVEHFALLAYGTAALTFCLIVVGGVVRISNSGLGCGPEGAGTKGWPLCGGRVIPTVDTHMVVEYTHRIIAALVVALIAALLVIAWRRYREYAALLWISSAAFGLVIVQAVLGGLTVEKGLGQELVAAHLGVAMIQLGLLLLLARAARAHAKQQALPDGDRQPAPERATRTIRWLTIAALVAVLGTIVAGGYMSASELLGTPSGTVRTAAHMACGKEFPTCAGDGLLPFGRSRAINIHVTHRAFMYLAAILVFALLVAVLVQRDRLTPRLALTLPTWASATVGLLLGQIVLGALNVWWGNHAWLVVAHLALGAALWSSLVFLSIESLGLPQPAAVRRRVAQLETVSA
jgi:heme A synthase